MNPRSLRSQKMQIQPKTKSIAKVLENRRQQPQTEEEQPEREPTTTSSPFTQKSSTCSLYPVASQVEVTSDEDGFRGAWYVATVIQPPPPPSSSSEGCLSSKLFVEYKNLLAEENGSDLLREFVDVAFVRPTPPLDDHHKVESFQVGDDVDAYFQDGWWTGVVTQVLETSCKYRVFFSNPPEELEFGSSELRVSRNWVDGKWVRPEKRMREPGFSPGTAVEVNIDPDNSPDVWFPATVIENNANSSFLVEYQSSQQAGRERVTVDSLHIRPLPPPSGKKGFSLLEKVDAFYDFRWLSGVVTKILADGRYIVYFKRTKKEKELSQADLRLHMEWNDGKWVHSSQETSIASMSEKSAVNGGRKEKSCLPARHLDAKEDHTEEKNNIITLKSIQKARQTPGRGKTDNSNTLQSNRRMKQTRADVNSIYLKSSKRLNEKTASDTPVSPEPVKVRFKLTEGLNNGTSAGLDSTKTKTPDNAGKSSLKQSEDKNQSSAPIDKMEEDEKSVGRRKRGRPAKPLTPQQDTVDPTSNGSLPSPNGKALKLQVSELEPLEFADAFDQTPDGSSVFSPYGGAIVVGLTHNGKYIRPLSESPGQHKKGESSKAVKDDVKHSSTSKDMEDEAKDSNTKAGHESVGNEHQKDGEVTNLKRKRGRGRPPKVLFRVGSPSSKEAVVESKEAVLDTDTQGTPETVSEVEPVAVARSTDISDSNPLPATSRKRRQRKISDHLHGFQLQNGGKRQPRKGPKSPTEMVKVEATEPVKLVTLRSARRQRSTKQVEPPTEDGGDNLREKSAKAPNNGIAKDVDSVAGTSGNVSDDDRPLSAWFEGAHSPPTTADTRAGTAGQSYEAEEGREGKEIQLVNKPQDAAQEKPEAGTVSENVRRDTDTPETQDQTTVQSTAIVAVDSRELPFVKNSLIWQMIESMDVLKRIPQKPHFHPLYDCKEECREGLAIGSMVTFTSLVDRISRLQFGDPKSLIEGYFEALSDLEAHGFNVGPVRDRLTALLSIKGKFAEAETTTAEIEAQIAEHDSEKCMIEEEISEIDKKIAELNQKRAVAVSKKEVKDAEMKVLQSSVDAMKGSLDNAKQEFEKVATSEW